MFPSIFYKWLAMTKNLFRTTVYDLFNKRGYQTLSVIDPDTDNVVDIKVPTIREIAAKESLNILDDYIVSDETTFTSLKIDKYIKDRNKVINSIVSLYLLSGYDNYAIATVDAITETTGLLQTNDIVLKKDEYAIFKIDLTDINISFKKFIFTYLPLTDNVITEYSIDNSTYYGFLVYDKVKLNKPTSVIYIRITNRNDEPIYISNIVINYSN